MSALDLVLGWEGLALDLNDPAGGVTRRLVWPDRWLEAGAMLAVTGPSGVGKSTLLHLVAGLVAPSGGRILRSGLVEPANDGARAAWRRDHLGYVFQDFHLIPELSLIGNVILPAGFGGGSVAARRENGERLLARFGLTDIGRRASSLSRGEQQRVAVARALAHRPPILLADEPTASLDAENAALITEALIEGAREIGAVLIAVSHDPRLIARFSDVLVPGEER